MCVSEGVGVSGSPEGVVVDGARDSEAVEPLHGGDGGGDGLRRAEGVRPHVPRWQVAVLLQPRLETEMTGVSHHGNAGQLICVCPKSRVEGVFGGGAAETFLADSTSNGFVF